MYVLVAEYMPYSVPLQSMETLLRNSGGQYSANDISQYIFWTGDESGVAHAIVELIDEGLVSSRTHTAMGLLMRFLARLHFHGEIVSIFLSSITNYVHVDGP